MHRSIEAMRIKTAHFHLIRHAELPCDLEKTVNVPKTLHLYPNDVSMQIWSKYID